MSGVWRLRIRHHTVHRYDAPVTGSYNEIRMQPLDTPGQTVLTSIVEIRPDEGHTSWTDYFGTRVVAFDLHRPHDALEVTVTTTVETSTAPTGTGSPDGGWDALTGSEVTEDLAEYLLDTTLTAVTDELREAGQQLRRETPGATATAVLDFVHDRLVYRSGTTHVHSSADEAWQARSGVCQDYAHLSLALLRSTGIPARYVSGYLHPRRDAEIDVPARGESHAWVEYFIGGWHAWDPTNDRPPGPGHVVTGRGRDYADVPPLRGMFAGAAASSVDAEVTITRLR